MASLTTPEAYSDLCSTTRASSYPAGAASVGAVGKLPSFFAG
jgi:hypothetical protein